ncbi:hypothetical protein DSO57_1028799 [Entomophthora muscae]|uniref:Uncharacterized protein n=1 Tax=Entomophthora muscae TaxID=34485 RepID=A0ACC2RG12_9FUNG|nr:hypothetical protein DSO57_1028799 [Entomophthora muscae]
MRRRSPPHSFIYDCTFFTISHICSFLATKSDHFALHAGDFFYYPLPTVPPAQDFSKLGFVYITVLGLADQVVPHTGSWRPLATAVNYLIRIAPIVYMAFQAWPASPVGVQPDSVMGCDTFFYDNFVINIYLDYITLFS